MQDASLNSISIVVSVYNEEEGLALFWQELNATIVKLNIEAEVIFINDGSTDNSKALLSNIINTNSRVEFILIDFSKNYGHESAMIAGIDVATKDSIVCLDADLQHPPEKIIEMVKAFNSGYEIVTMIREKREDNGLVKNLVSKLFYRFLNTVSEHNFDNNASDFFMISKRISLILKDNFRERNRFLRGYIQAIGFSKTSLYFDAPARLSGKSSYSFLSLVKLSFNAIFSFSNKPLQISLFISVLFALFTMGFMGFSLWVYLFGSAPPSGYTTLIIFQSMCFTVLFLLIGILSIYFGKSLDEMRNRPIYLVKELTKTNTKQLD